MLPMPHVGFCCWELPCGVPAMVYMRAIASAAPDAVLFPSPLPSPLPQGGPLAVMKPRYAKTVRKLGFKTRRLS